MAYNPDLTTLGFLVRDNTVLMVHRIARDTDEQLGKWNGLGGKVEPGEDAWQAMTREIREEAGVEVTSMRLRGSVNWPGFHADGTGVFALVFLIDAWEGEILKENEEGPLAFQPIDNLANLEMWGGDRFFIPLVFDPDVESFHLVIPYEDGEEKGWDGTIRRYS